MPGASYSQNINTVRLCEQISTFSVSLDLSNGFLSNRSFPLNNAPKVSEAPFYIVRQKKVLISLLCVTNYVCFFFGKSHASTSIFHRMKINFQCTVWTHLSNKIFICCRYSLKGFIVFPIQLVVLPPAVKLTSFSIQTWILVRKESIRAKSQTTKNFDNGVL